MPGTSARTWAVRRPAPPCPGCAGCCPSAMRWTSPRGPDESWPVPAAPRAAAALAFEFAARVQAELEAVDWVTAEQKVTQAQPYDFNVRGWAGGVLVCFEVRGGRLSAWTQRASPAATLASFPRGNSPAWADFARQAAELAALLAC